ncbi:hypothetical protein DL89DRAFT_270799, partial [Linderina pennispora]
MELQLSAAQRVPSDALGLIFDFIEYGRRLKDGWEKLGQKRVVGGTASLLSIAQVCHAWRVVALPYFYQNTETLLNPIFHAADSEPKLIYPNLSMAAAAGQSLSVRSAHLRLSLDHIANGASIRLLNAGVPPTVTFPNASELKLSFYSSNDFDRADYSVQAAAFTERICQLFPKAHDVSFIVCSWLWNGSEDVWRSLMHSIVPTPRTLICCKLLNESTTLRDGISNGVRRLYLGTNGGTGYYPIVHSNRGTVEELVIRVAVDHSHTAHRWNMPVNQDPLFSYKYPKLARLSIETRGDARKLFTRSATNRFPSLTSLSLLTFCEVDIGSLVGDRGETLTSLTMYLTESLVQSLRDRLFPSLAYVRILGSILHVFIVNDNEALARAAMEVVQLPFLIAPNAEMIENYVVSGLPNLSHSSVFPDNHPHPRLQYLVLCRLSLSLSQFHQILVCLPGLTRVRLRSVVSDNGASYEYSDDEIRTLLTGLPVFSTRLRRLDFEEVVRCSAGMVIAITKLPSLRMVTVLGIPAEVGYLMDEIDKPVYHEYRNSLNRLLFHGVGDSWSQPHPD